MIYPHAPRLPTSTSTSTLHRVTPAYSDRLFAAGEEKPSLGHSRSSNELTTATQNFAAFGGSSGVSYSRFDGDARSVYLVEGADNRVYLSPFDPNERDRMREQRAVRQPSQRLKIDVGPLMLPPRESDSEANETAQFSSFAKLGLSPDLAQCFNDLKPILEKYDSSLSKVSSRTGALSKFLTTSSK